VDRSAVGPQVYVVIFFSEYRAVWLIPLVALRKVLHLRAVTQCAVLESFSLFLVLSSKVCLVPAPLTKAN
jgi:hypothetical protein